MSNLLAVIGATIIASIIVPVGFQEAIKRKWVTEKEAELTLVITVPIYIITAIVVFVLAAGKLPM